MAIEKINFTYPKGTLQSVYDVDEMTALELAAKTSKKVDECVELVNGVEQSAIEATAVVDEMRIAQDQFMTENNDIRAQLVVDNQTHLDALEASNTIFQNDVTASKTTFENNMNTSLTTFQTNINASKTMFENNMNTALSEFETDLNTTKTTFENQITQTINDANTVTIPNAVNVKLDTMAGDGSLSAIINDQLLSSYESEVADINEKFSNIPLIVEDFGAVGDGVTDDRLAIQAAIDAAFAKGGGTVLLSTKIYAVSVPPVLKSNVTLCGQGVNSVLKVTTANRRIENANRASYVDVNITIENLKIINALESSNNENDTCIDLWYVTNLTIRNVTLTNARGHGIYSRFNNNVLIENIMCIDTYTMGVAVTHGNDIVIRHVRGSETITGSLVDIEPNAGDLITDITVDDVYSLDPAILAVSIGGNDNDIQNLTLTNITALYLSLTGVTNGNVSNIFIKGLASRGANGCFTTFLCRKLNVSNLNIYDATVTDCTKIKISSCWDMQWNNIYVEGDAGSGITIDNVSLFDVKINNITIRNGGGYAIRHRNSTNVTFSNIKITNSNYGVSLYPTTTNDNTKFINISTEGVTTGFFLAGINNMVYVDGDLSSTTSRFELHSSNVGQIEIGNLGGVKRKFRGSAIPTSGTFYVGDEVVNISPAVGGYMGWLCILAGTIFTQIKRAYTTAYNVNDIVYNGTNAYKCVVAGTTGTGGSAPIHTGGTAVDGTVTWEYIGKATVFSPYGLIA
jgi:hypothetical protein